MSVLQEFWSLGGISDLQNPALWLQNAMVGTGRTASGVSVTPESAMSLSAYFACIRNVSEDIAGLPYKIFKELHPGREPAPNHPVFPIIHDHPNDQTVAMVFWETMLHWALGWGNGYAEIVRLPAGRVTEMILIHPSRVVVKRDSVTGVLMYEVHNEDGTTLGLLQSEMYHLRGLGDEFGGYSVARIGAESFGRAMATQEYSSAFFGNGSTFSGVYKTEGKLDMDARKRLKETWPTGLPSAHNPLFLEGGMEWQKMSVDPNEAQMIETMQFTVADVARWFRMPLHKIQSMEAATFSNIEHQAREYVGDTLLPWMLRIEAETDRKLLKESDRGTFESKHVVRALLRGDMQTQSAFYSTMTAIGALSINEVREFEGMNPVEGGDEHRVQLNTGGISESPEPEEAPEDDESPGESRRRQVQGAKKATSRIFGHVAEGLAAMEVDALKRNSKRCEGEPAKFAAWSAKFYGEHKTRAIAAMRFPSMALGEMICMACGEGSLAAQAADAIDVMLDAGECNGAQQIKDAPARIEGLKGAPALAAEKMPDRIEAVVYRAIGVGDDE